MLNPGGTNGNDAFPSFMENTMFPQLQLFAHGQIPVEGASSINKSGADVAASIQQRLPVSKNNFYANEFRGMESTLNHQPVSTGLKLSCEEEERNSTLTSVTENATPLRLSLGTDVKTEIHRQKEEFIQFIKLQEQNLMKGVQEMHHRHTISLLATLEKRLNQKLHERDIEIENMHTKNRELTEKIKQVALEAQSWHCKAKYNESIVNTLNINIQKLMAQCNCQAREGSGDSEVDDAISCSNDPRVSAVQFLRTCKACNSKEVSVLIMPCRHLCLCSDCESFVNVCPVCQVKKTETLHVHIS